ncbi:MAG: hypothetical protein N2450_00825 [bacterium]|nr:hypothetical protein [bacterium]
MKQEDKGFCWTISEFQRFFTTDPITKFLWKSDDPWSKQAQGLFLLHPSLSPIECNANEIESLRQGIIALLTRKNISIIPLRKGEITFSRDENVIGIRYSTPNSIWQNKSFSIYDLILLADQLFPTSFCVESNLQTQVVLAAPHSPSESKVHILVREVAKLLNCGFVIAFGFRDSKSKYFPTPIGRFIHVNRPYEVLLNEKNRKVSVKTQRAEMAYQQYIQNLQLASKSELPIPFLVEIHGAKNRIPNYIQIAQNGFKMVQIEKIKEIAVEEAKNLLPKTIEVIVEQNDVNLFFRAKQAKKHGSMHPSISKQSLHIEIPKALREDQTIQATINFLFQCIQKIIP